MERADDRAISRRADLAWGLGTALLSLLLACLALQIWRADLRVPFAYGGDAPQNQLIVKSVLDHGWYQTNPDLAAPFGSKLYDFPVVSGDNLQIVLMKVLGIFTNDSAVVVNLFFLLGFALAGASAFACMRLLGVSRPSAAVGATLFATLPGHFLQGETHLFISAYYAVPIGAYLALRSLQPEPVDWRKRSTLAWAIAASVVVGSAYVYYAAFTITLLLAAALARLVIGPRRSARTPLVFLALIAATVAFNHAPNAIYKAKHGSNAATARPAAETERYSFKIAQAVLPMKDHRVGKLARLRARYDADGTQLQEGDPQALGVVASLGFIALLGMALLALADRRRFAGGSQLIFGAAFLVLVAVIVATVGGFSAVLAYLATGQLRAWGRIAFFIAFFSLFAVARGGDLFAIGRRPRVVLGVGVLVLAIGFLDQTNKGIVPPYSATAREYRSDAAFVSEIERLLPSGAAVFQLPYEPFPEPQPEYIPNGGPYDLARGYLHSTGLRWSYGLMKGRAGDWQAAVTQLPPAVLVKAVVAAGFSGIYLDSRMYADNGQYVKAALEREVGTPWRTSPDLRLLFLDLREYAAQLRSESSPADMAALRKSVLRPVRLDFSGGGFSDVQHDQSGVSYLAGNQARITVTNAGLGPRRVAVTFEVKPAGGSGTLSVAAPGGRVQESRVAAGGSRVSLAFQAAPGKTYLTLSFRGGKPGYALPDQTQTYYLRVVNPLVADSAFTAFGVNLLSQPPNDPRPASWLQPFGTI